MILLQNGFGFSYGGVNNNYYKSYENLEKIKENAKFGEKYNLKIVDDEKKEFHELNCPLGMKGKNLKIVSKSQILKDYHKCKYCYLKDDFKNDIEKFLSKTEIPDLYKKFHNIELFLIYPNSFLVRSDSCRTNICREIIKNINNSKKTIDIALYGFEGQKEILDALIKAQKRGVKIRVVTDSDGKGKNIYKDTVLLEKNFPVVKDKSSDLMHNKFIIFDDKTIFTGSVNFSSSGFGAYNSNSGIIIHNEEISNAYKCEFDEMYKGNFHNNKKIDCSKGDIKISDNIEASVYFSPKGNIIQNVFKPLIKSSKSEILVSIFFLTNKDITNELINAKNNGVNIKVIMDATSALNPKSSLKILRNSKIPVKVENWGGKSHEKSMLIDGKILIMGSANFTNSGAYRNDENLLVIKNQEIGKFYRNFFMKLYSSIDDKYLKEIPSAEGLESGYSCYDGADNDYDGDIDEEDKGCRKNLK